MKSPGSVDIEAAFKDGRAIDRAMQAAVFEAIRIHRQAGVPLVFWEDGKVIELSADEAEARALAGGCVDASAHSERLPERQNAGPGDAQGTRGTCER